MDDHGVGKGDVLHLASATSSANHEASGSIHHLRKTKSGIILEPRPSNDPEDPLVLLQPCLADGNDG